MPSRPASRSGGGRVPKGAPDGPSAPAAAPVEGPRDRPPPGPPEDAVTSFEDLPADLFGEDESGAYGDGGPAPADDAVPAAHGPAGGGSGGLAAADAEPPSSPTVGGPTPPLAADVEADGEVDGDEDPITTVGRLFPGRVIALEPLDEDEADGGPDASAAEAPGPEGGEPPEADAEARESPNDTSPTGMDGPARTSRRERVE